MLPNSIKLTNVATNTTPNNGWIYNNLNAQQTTAFTTTPYTTCYTTPKFAELNEQNDLIIKGRIIEEGIEYFKNDDSELAQEFLYTYNRMIMELLENKYNKLKWQFANKFLFSKIIIKKVVLDIIIDVESSFLYIQYNNSTLFKQLIKYDIIQNIKSLCPVLTREDLLEGLKNL